MPSVGHELLVTLFREHPTLLFHLLTTQLGLKLPPYAEIHIETDDSNLSQLLRKVSIGLHVDLVFTLYDQQRTPLLCLIVEVQRSIKARKKYTLPAYATVQRARRECPVWVVILAMSPEVARWADVPIDLGPYTSHYHPVVLGPGDIPRVDAVQARAMPPLAILSAAVHGNRPGGLDIVRAALDTLQDMEQDSGLYYFDWILSELNPTTRQCLEEIMYARKYEYRSEFARTYFAQGKAEGHAEGKAEGRVEGKAEGRAEGILAVLKARHLRVPATVRQQLLQCKDLALLDRWLARAVQVSTVAELFAPEDAPPAPARSNGRHRR